MSVHRHWCAIAAANICTCGLSESTGEKPNDREIARLHEKIDRLTDLVKHFTEWKK